MTIPRPPLESSRQGKSKSDWTIFVKFIFNLFFQNNFQICIVHRKMQLDCPSCGDWDCAGIVTVEVQFQIRDQF